MALLLEDPDVFPFALVGLPRHQVGELISSKGGVVAAQEVAPYLDIPPDFEVALPDSELLLLSTTNTCAACSPFVRPHRCPQHFVLTICSAYPVVAVTLLHSTIPFSCAVGAGERVVHAPCRAALRWVP